MCTKIGNHFKNRKSQIYAAVFEHLVYDYNIQMHRNKRPEKNKYLWIMKIKSISWGNEAKTII